MIQQRVHRVEADGETYLIRAGRPGKPPLIHRQRGDRMRLVTDPDELAKVAVAFHRAAAAGKAALEHRQTRRYRAARGFGVWLAATWRRFTAWVARSLTPP